jgi:hypothetical protein
MSDNKFESKHIIIMTTCLFLGILYLIKSRKKKFSPALVSEQYHKNQFSTWLTTHFSLSKLSDSWDHPEGPNIGFESNESWLENDSHLSPAKIDLLHQGHTKGGKIIC